MSHAIKGIATRDYILCVKLFKWIVNIVMVYKQGSHLLTRVQMLMYMCKLCVNCFPHKFFGYLDLKFLNRDNFC